VEKRVTRFKRKELLPKMKDLGILEEWGGWGAEGPHKKTSGIFLILIHGRYVSHAPDVAVLTQTPIES